MDLRKTKWLIFVTFRPPSQPVEYFFKRVGYTLDIYREAYENFFLAGDFNTEETEPCLSEFLTSYDSKSLVKHKTCFKNTENPRCIIFFYHKYHW